MKNLNPRQHYEDQPLPPSPHNTQRESWTKWLMVCFLLCVIELHLHDHKHSQENVLLLFYIRLLITYLKQLGIVQVTGFLDNQTFAEKFETLVL